ncbi:MAG: pilus assembly protein PilM [Phycisphaerales bacterium]|nr:pilus assembly protein PilM [Phycisphaerales bacterium]
MKRKAKLGKLGSSVRSNVRSNVGAIRAGFPLSIDFGVGSLKVLQLSGSDQPSISAASQLTTPDDLLDKPAKRLLFQMEALPKLISSGKFKTTRAVCMIPVGQMVCKHFQIQPIDGVSIEDVAAGHLSTQIGCDPSALLVRCNLVEGAKTGGKREVIAYAASREFVGRLMGTLKSAKLETVGIHNDFEAIARAVQPQAFSTGSDKIVDPRPVLVLDMGCSTTNVLIMHGARTVFARSIEHGAMHFDAAICHQLRCTMLEAREIRQKLKTLVPERAVSAVSSSGLPGMPPPPEEESTASEAVQSSASVPRPVGPQVDLSEPLEILTDEVSMCLRYHRTLFPGTPIERVMFVGGLSSQVSICEHLARNLNMSALSVDPLARLGRTGKVPTSGVDLSIAQPGWASVVGGALIPTDL